MSYVGDALGIEVYILLRQAKPQKMETESPASRFPTAWESGGNAQIKKSMQKMTNKEEEIMHILCKLEKAFIKDVIFTQKGIYVQSTGKIE